MRSLKEVAWKSRIGETIECRRRLTRMFGKGISMGDMLSMEARGIIERVDELLGRTSGSCSVVVGGIQS